ncbi:MAG: NYN domain-containing protein [Oscillospiraceae bacterium]
MANEKRYAVLIDADNISDKYIKLILDEISNDGVATYKRIYGDWTQAGLSNWKNVLLENSVTPIQQYGYTVGKNSTDSAMIIDAMDILYSNNVDGFCLVTSDSDFTRLASRLRESGMAVVGMGEKKTPKPFVSACNKFKYLDVLAKANIALPVEDEKKAQKPAAVNNSKKPKPKAEPIIKEDVAKAKTNDTEILGNLTEIKNAIISIVDEASDEDGWVFIGDLGNKIQKRYPDFDVRNFGFRKFTPFIKSFDLFEMKSVEISGTNNKLIYLREKDEQ